METLAIGLGTEIFAFLKNHPDDIKRAAQFVVQAIHLIKSPTSTRADWDAWANSAPDRNYDAAIAAAQARADAAKIS